VTWPGERRVGHVSVRLICAVKPFAAQTAAPICPLPSGISCDACAGGAETTMFARLTRFGTSTSNALPIHAVDGAACAAGAATTKPVSPAISHAATRRGLLSPDIQSLLVEPFDRRRNYCAGFS
jgi:hypothetical protein